MKKSFWTTDKIVSLAAIGISLFTLFIFVKQTNIIERQSRLSVMPYLMIETSDNGFDRVFIVDVVNHGVGPAIIDYKRIYLNGEAYDLEFVDFLQQKTPMDSVNVMSSSTLQDGLAIPAGGTRNVVKVGGNDHSYFTFLETMSNLQEEDSFMYEIYYSSIYGDRWKITSKSERPEKVE